MKAELSMNFPCGRELCYISGYDPKARFQLAASLENSMSFSSIGWIFLSLTTEVKIEHLSNDFANRIQL
jgi:hypothetical protein